MINQTNQSYILKNIMLYLTQFNLLNKGQTQQSNLTGYLVSALRIFQGIN